jgi:hypothetical protein
MVLSTTREATSFVATRDIPSILWNQKVHYRIHKALYFFLLCNRIIQSIPPPRILQDIS